MDQSTCFSTGLYHNHYFVTFCWSRGSSVNQGDNDEMIVRFSSDNQLKTWWLTVLDRWAHLSDSPPSCPPSPAGQWAALAGLCSVRGLQVLGADCGKRHRRGELRLSDQNPALLWDEVGPQCTCVQEIPKSVCAAWMVDVERHPLTVCCLLQPPRVL